ncbi:Cytochrome P450 714C3 [Dichanthelium oligosanthes]|uniref:RING-type E3 ubiquitin transferase n=1 Tax=Dichanthelium oligosanthes TaxID=888268 RepID=A0A1E5UWF3_9POAL|nr:Cytochrome P450 714C3 [Dichanthelium oligosanthes]
MSDNQGHSSSCELLATQPDVQCLVCTRPFTLDTEVTDSFESLAICGECKMTVLSDDNRDETTRTNRQTRQRRQRSRVTRHETMEDAFSQQFSQLINLARQGHEADVDSPTVPRQHASYSSTPSRSQRWHSSDDESDGLNYADSVFGEIESNISFGDYGGESDASVDQHTAMSREVVIQLESESYMNTDTDIDPMNAGLDRWDSDDPEDDEDEQSEESDLDEAGGWNEQESEDTVWTWGTAGSQEVNRTNLRANTEVQEIRRVFIGNPGDYVDASQFEMLLEQFAEDNSTRRGAPPAAISSVENLPSVVISVSNEIIGGVTCPVCKDHMPIETIAKQLPCMHLYHSSCILPWLSSRNTCPVCRYELPTDDTEYERSKRAAGSEEGIHGVVERTHLQETVEETSYEPEVEGRSNTVGGTMEGTNTREHAVYSAQQPNGAHGRHRWLFIAAAPVNAGLYILLCEGKILQAESQKSRATSLPMNTCHVFKVLSVLHQGSESNINNEKRLSFAHPILSPLMEKLLEIILVLLIIFLGLALVYLYDILWLRLAKIRKKLRRQGIHDPKPTLLYGNTQEMKRIRQELKYAQRQDTNMNSYISTIFPHFLLWRKTYGMCRILAFAFLACIPLLNRSCGDIACCSARNGERHGHWTPSELGKPHYLMKSHKPLFGEAILAANGDLWAYEKKILAPEFFMEKIKGMIGLIVDATVPLLQAGENILDGTGGSKEIYVDGYLRDFSADVIARACFGSSFTKGKDIFCKLRQLQKAISQQDTFVGLSALWSRHDGTHMSTHNNILHAIIDGADQRPSYSSASEDFIVGNCKNIYFAGHETAAVTTTWCLMLLAAHPDWQVRARAEALEVCCGQMMLDINALRQLKVLTMVIQETLRLYSPASLIMRKALTDVRLGGVDVPRGTIIHVAISMLHLDKEAWGPDADEFRPDRFVNGAATACKPAHPHVHAVWIWTQTVYWAKPGNGRAEGGSCTPADQILVLNVTWVPTHTIISVDH